MEVQELVEAPEFADKLCAWQAIAMYCELVLGGDGVRLFKLILLMF